jgi:hypothetical protein
MRTAALISNDAWAVQLDGIQTRVEPAPGVCNHGLKLKCDEPLSNVAFNLKLRRYTKADGCNGTASLGTSGVSELCTIYVAAFTKFTTPCQSRLVQVDRSSPG